MLFRATVVLQLHIAVFARSTSVCLSPFVSGDASKDKKDKMNDPEL